MARPVKLDSKQPTDEQLEARIDFAIRLLATRQNKSAMKAAMRAFVDRQMANVYGQGRVILTARTIEGYLARAKERMAEVRKESLEYSTEKAIALYESIIADPKTSARDKIKAQERLDKIQGVESPTRLIVTGDEGNKVPDAAMDAIEAAYGRQLDD